MHSTWRETCLRVRYAETDQMGVVYHANYLTWFEIGRVEWMRQIGIEYRRMEQEDGCCIAVVEVRARYRAPARYDEELIVRTCVRRFRSFVIEFAYEIVRAEDGVLLCEGETVHVVTDLELKKRPLPEKYAAMLKSQSGPQ